MVIFTTKKIKHFYVLRKSPEIPLWGLFSSISEIIFCPPPSVVVSLAAKTSFIPVF